MVAAALPVSCWYTIDSANATNRLGVVLSSMSNGPTASMSRAMRRVRAHVRHRLGLVEAERAVAVKERRRGRGLPALDRQQAQLRRDPAAGGEASHAAAGSKHPMAGHDDEKRIPAQRLAHGARQAARLPRRSAISPYDSVAPGGMVRATS